MDFSFSHRAGNDSDTLVLPAYEDGDTAHLDPALTGRYGATIRRATEGSGFKGKNGQTCLIHLYEEDGYDRLVLLGFGKKASLDAVACEAAGGKLFAAISSSGAKSVAFPCGDGAVNAELSGAGMAAHFCTGLGLRSYKFDKYKTEKPDNGKTGIGSVEVVGGDSKEAESIFVRNYAAVQGTVFARDLVSEPANVINPAGMAARIEAELAPLGVAVEIIDRKKLEKLGMDAVIAVGKGSEIPPCVVVMRWQGSGKKGGAPLALVGKGITFDTGGISIKPSKEMDIMKMDMGGAAAVAGTMKALALRKSKASVIGIAGIAENMPDGKAYRPSDIIKTLSGKTVEVLNTDAEGRLVLADCLTYVQRTYKPDTVIDLATLTGSMMVALGFDYCGSFVNDDGLWAGLDKAGKATGEKLWRMPLDEQWRKEVESTIADIKNLGSSGSYAGACTAAGFLEHFIEEGTKWAHMDIAGTAWIRSDRPTTPKGASGFDVRVLDRFIEDNFEQA